jgi:vacuolar-type H+-ATPase subunit D/Vma8
LRLYTTQLKIRTLTAQMEALQQRRNALILEAETLPKKLQDVQTQRESLVKEYQADYSAMKSAMGVPDGNEINLETGEVIQVNQ